MAKTQKEEANLSPQQQKMKALQAAMEKIEKSFGKGAIMKMGAHSPFMPLPSVRRQAVWQHSSMLSTLSTVSMQRS